MTYDHEVREEAFSLYCHGLSLQDIVSWLSESLGVSLHPSTVAVWSRRYHWLERRVKIQRRIEQLSDENRAMEVCRLLGDLRRLRAKILHESMSLEFRCAEGAVRSLVIVQRIMDRLTQPEEGAISKDDLDTIIGIIFDALGEDEEVGVVLERRRNPVLENIERRLAENPGSAHRSWNSKRQPTKQP